MCVCVCVRACMRERGREGERERESKQETSLIMEGMKIGRSNALFYYVLVMSRP